MLLAFSTKSKILLTVDSPYSFETLTLINPDILIDPLKISSPGVTSLGSDSPVKALVSKEVFPSITIPSNGTFSPGLIIIISPILTSSGSTFNTFPSFSMFA